VCDSFPAVVDALARELEARGVYSPAALRFVIARGHAAGALALEQAAALFERGEAAQALIVGIDTHGDRATLERLGLLGALKSRGSPRGFLPGEASAVLCLRPASEGSCGVLVRGVGLGEEGETPSTARGLTSAVSQSIVVAVVLVAVWRHEARSARAGIAHVLGAIGRLAGATEQARAEARAARVAVQGMRGILIDIQHETCGPVSLRPASLPQPSGTPARPDPGAASP
jgi:hypothetical protein